MIKLHLNLADGIKQFKKSVESVMKQMQKNKMKQKPKSNK